MPKPMILAAVGLMAVLAHLVFVYVLLPPRWRVNQSPDYFEVYEPTARNLLAGKGATGADGKPSVDYPPGFALILAGTFQTAEALGISEELGVRIEIVATVAATGLLVYIIAAQIFGWTTGLLASILWSFYPLQLWLSKQPDSGQPFTVLFLLSIYFVWLSLKEGRGAVLSIFAAGVLAGLSSLVRPIAISISLVFLLFLWLFAPKKNLARQLALSALLLSGNILAVLPWENWARQATGKWIPLSMNGPASILDGVTLSAARKPLTASTPDDVRELIQVLVKEGRGLSTGELGKLIAREAVKHPVAAAKLLTMKAARSWYANDSRQFEMGIAFVQAPYLLLGIWGMLWIARNTEGPPRQFAVLAMLCVLYFWMMSTIVLSIVRYMLPVMTLVVICGASRLSHWFENRRIVKAASSAFMG